MALIKEEKKIDISKINYDIFNYTYLEKKIPKALCSAWHMINIFFMINSLYPKL